IYKTP
ncbi:hypothetical protein BVZ47_00769B, partial [Haemophilus influenzae]